MPQYTVKVWFLVNPPDAVAVPVCLLVLEGGPGSLETVYSALSSGTPTVVIKVK